MTIGGWSFKDKETAEKLKKLAERNGTGSTGKRRHRREYNLEIGGWIFMMTEEISGRSGTTPGVGVCNPYYINSDFELEEALTDSGSPIDVDVYNLSADPIEYVSEKYILAKNVMGVPIVDTVFCDEAAAPSPSTSVSSSASF